MARLVRHRQTKGADTDKPILPPPRHIPTLPSADSRDDRSDFRLGRIAEIGVGSFDGPILAEHRGTERRELRPLHLHKPTSGSPLSSSDLIGQECLECAFSRTTVASILVERD